jgi:sugar lactone lactonase YvrE
MSTKAHIPIEKSVARFLLGVMVAALLAPQLSAQYVSTGVSSGLFEPSGVAVDPDGNWYITDSTDNRIATYNPTSGVLKTLAGTAGTDTAGTNNGFGSAAQFSQPTGIVAARGGLVVVDQINQEIRFVSFAGEVSTLAGVPGVMGNQNGPALSATFTYPNGIVADGQGNLYIADEGNDAIRLIDTNNIVSTVDVGGYQFSAPAAVALDNNGNLWVADTGHDVIVIVTNNSATVMAGISDSPGTNDASFATSARFTAPAGLLWIGANNSLLISDTGNDTIRELYQTNVNGSPTYTVQTLAGIPHDPGFVNGVPGTAQFNGPTGLADDPAAFGFFIVDTGNNAVRVFQPAAPLPAVPTPVLGFVTFQPLAAGGGSVFTAASSAVFNNTAILAVEYQYGSQCYITYGPTPTNTLVNTIPTPGPTSGSSPPDYPGDGTLPPIRSIVTQIPDLTIYAVGEASGRQTSSVVSARYQFVTASPVIGGDNAASLLLTDVTTNAQMWYTLDGTPPVPGATNTFGPIQNGTYLTINIVTNTTFSAQAFADAFSPSGVAQTLLTPADIDGDKLTFGFESGECSSEFIAAAGQRFQAPVTLSLIPAAEIMYTLQFDAAVTNLTGPPVGINYSFQSMLTQPDPGRPGFDIPIPPDVAVGTNGPLQSLLLANNSLGLLEVGWVERPPFTNLYPTGSQTLISTSQAHDDQFTSGSGQVIVGSFAFVVPPTATTGETFQINLANASATLDGIHTPVFIQIVTNGALGGGAINSVKVVTVGSARYLVGDAAPFRWFNAGDFGDGTLQANDVSQVFQSAIYYLNTPPLGSDFFDVMDSSDGSDNNLYDGNDTNINSIKFGDGILAVDDVYVTYRRSLDPSLTWYDRFWTNGVRQAVAVPNTLSPLTRSASTPPAHKEVGAASGPRYIAVAADQVQSGGLLNVEIPIRVLAADALPIRVMMLGVEIDPLDGSPPITSAVSFTAVSGLDTSDGISASFGVNSYGGAWLDSTVPGVSGTTLIGTLNVTLPTNVTANSAYLVHFDHFSASPNGLALFHASVKDGLITVGNRTGSSWNDGIPDTWRLLYFGTVSNPLSAADADPDGDGASNWQEYIAGTNPMDATSVFKLLPTTTALGSGFALQWTSVVNKTYSLQSSTSLSSEIWTTVATNLTGAGQALQWTDTDASATAKFYRAVVQ